jgi:hypothetical protein
MAEQVQSKSGAVPQRFQPRKNVIRVQPDSHF